MIKSSKDFIRTKGWECGNFQPGPTNSIMDVNGLKVGHSTIISGSGILKPRKGPIRTGISAILSALVTECNDSYLNDIQGRHVTYKTCI